jgi:DNA-binding NarL/FixJ family response regulator
VSAAVRIVVIDSHEMVRAGLKAMLAGHPDVTVVGESDDARTGVTITEHLAPDVVLTEMRLRDADGLDVCRALVSSRSDVRVVVLTVHDDELSLSQALAAGARGYLLKRVSARELVAAVHRVRAGELVIDPSMANGGAATVTRVHAGHHWPGGSLGLTRRESEVLALLVAGMTNSAIATRLVLGEQTVKTHVRAIYRKLGVHDRDSAHARALREGLFH